MFLLPASFLLFLSNLHALPRYSGFSNDKPRITYVNPNEPLSLKVYGNNVPKDGYYFTTATKCEDYQLTNISTISTVFAQVTYHECSVVELSLPKGLPFDVGTLTYHLCHPNASAANDKLMQIHKKEPENLAENIGSRVIICCICILAGAFSSGMTLGYMKFSIIELNRIIAQGGLQAKRARRILRFRRRSNWLVVAFSLTSSICTVVFTMNVEKMLEHVPSKEILKIVIPTMVLTLFAEMLPQAVCNSKIGFNLASGLWIVTVLIFIVTFPIAYPASLILGKFLKRSMREVLTQDEKVCMIRNMAKNSNDDERKIIENATTFSKKKVDEMMVPMQDVFLLSRSQRLNRSTILTLVEKGYTRVPVCHEKNEDAIVGILNVKDLILVASELINEPTVKEVLTKIEALKEGDQKKKFVAKYVSAEMSAQLLLEQMKKGDFHIACVVKHIRNEPKVVGIVTIEDILEEVFGEIDSSNETRVRSSVDDRGDNAVIGWCREAGSDKKYPLSFSQQLRVLQLIFEECTVLKKMNVDIMKVKQLLSSDRIKTVKAGVPIPPADALHIIWRGDIEITKRNSTEPIKMKIGATPENQVRNEQGILVDKSIPAFVFGKQLLNKFSKKIGCNYKEEIKEEEQITQVKAESDVFYFMLNLTHMCKVINGGELSNGSRSTTMDSLQQTPTTSPAVSTANPPETVTENTPLLKEKKQ